MMRHAITLLMFATLPLFAADMANFERPTTAKETEDVRYIVNTMAPHASATGLVFKAWGLKKAGSRLHDLHPLRFLETVFVDEQATKSIKQLKGHQGGTWTRLVRGLSKSFEVEADHNNLNTRQIAEFSKSINVDPQEITPFIEKRNWRGLMEKLCDIKA